VRHAAGYALDVAGVHGLQRVHDQQVRFDRIDDVYGCGQIVFRRQEQPVQQCPRAFRTLPYLAHGFFRGDDQSAAFHPCPTGRNFQQQRGFSYSGFAR